MKMSKHGFIFKVTVSFGNQEKHKNEAKVRVSAEALQRFLIPLKS